MKRVHKYVLVKTRFLPQYLNNKIADDENALSLPIKGMEAGDKSNYLDTPKTESSYRTLPMTDDVYTMHKKHKELQEKRKRCLAIITFMKTLFALGITEAL